MLTNPFEDATDDQSDDGDTPSLSRSAGKNSAAEQGVNVPMDWKPTVREPIPVVRCTAIKTDGTQCKKWSIRGTNVCLRHGGQLPSVREHANAVVESARLRIIGLADNAIDTLEELLDPGTADAVRLKAATELLDRGGIKGAPDLTVEVDHKISASEEINKRLASIATRLAPKPEEPEDLGETEDAEVLEEPSE